MNNTEASFEFVYIPSLKDNGFNYSKSDIYCKLINGKMLPF